MALFMLLLAGAMGNALAEEPFYRGTWKIESAVVAPWWEDKAHKPDPAGVKALVGQTVTITATSIRGPRMLACSRPHYEVKDYPADMLFQGQFGEMHGRDQSIDPAKVAATVGFRGSNWKTLVTGCAVDIEYHFIDAGTAAFGLNNYVYTMKKAR